MRGGGSENVNQNEQPRVARHYDYRMIIAICGMRPFSIGEAVNDTESRGFWCNAIARQHWQFINHGRVE
jgi:hypothetical protein